VSPFEVRHMIDGAPEYIIDKNGLVRHGLRPNSLVTTHRTRFRGRRYVNLIVNGKVKRFYIDPLVKKYFGHL
jgi:hypothetical protein